MNNYKGSRNSQVPIIKMKIENWLLIIGFIFASCSSPRIIDTHIHLYDTRRDGGVPWPPPSDDVLFRPTLPAHYDAVSKANGVSATVIVEASDSVEDNQWVLDLVKHNPRRYIGLVGNLPIGTDEFAGLLNRFAADERFVGIRLRGFPKGVTGFNDAVWRDLQLLADKGLTLDVLLANYDLDDIARIAKRVPDQPRHRPHHHRCAGRSRVGRQGARGGGVPQRLLQGLRHFPAQRPHARAQGREILRADF